VVLKRGIDFFVNVMYFKYKHLNFKNMIGTLKSGTENIFQFIIGEKVYEYIENPIQAWTCNARDNSECWGGRTNFKVSNSDIPEKQLDSLQAAFVHMSCWATLDSHSCGFVENFETKTFYYDNEKSIKSQKERHPEETAFFENFVKVESWIDLIYKTEGNVISL
jgi:hypothetical protein